MSPEERDILAGMFADTEQQIRAMFRLLPMLSEIETPMAVMKRQHHTQTMAELMCEQADTVDLLGVDPRLATPDLRGPH